MNLQPGVGYNFTTSGGAVSLDIEQPWQHWEPPHPFKVIAYKSGSNYLVRVVPGTINSIVPQIGGNPMTDYPPPTLNIGSSMTTNLVYIYLVMPADVTSTPAVWPNVPLIAHDTSPQTDSDTSSYLLLAQVDNSNGSVIQYVKGSQSGERYKCGTNDAVYFYGQI